MKYFSATIGTGVGFISVELAASLGVQRDGWTIKKGGAVVTFEQREVADTDWHPRLLENIAAFEAAVADCLERNKLNRYAFSNDFINHRAAMSESVDHSDDGELVTGWGWHSFNE